MAMRECMYGTNKPLKLQLFLFNSTVHQVHVPHCTALLNALLANYVVLPPKVVLFPPLDIVSSGQIIVQTAHDRLHTATSSGGRNLPDIKYSE